MNAVDTNVLIYAHDPRDPERSATALSLIGSLEDGALLWQVACEYLNASRKLEAHGFAWEKAWSEIRRLSRLWHVVLPDWRAIETARDLLERYSLSYWDAMILGACVTGGVERIYTEDFTGYPRVDGVEVVNPFESSTGGS